MEVCYNGYITISLRGMIMKLIKGTRVCFMHEGKMNYGVVSKGGSVHVTVAFDGGEYSVKGSVHAFKPSEHPLPNASEVNPMASYTIKNYKEIQGHGDSPTFSAKIYKNGKAIIHAMNDGWGGPNMYTGIKGRKEVDDFEMAAKDWVTAATGLDSETEGADFWITWEVFERPFGKTATESLKWLAKLRKEYPKEKTA